MAEHVQITVRSTSRFGGKEDQLIFRGTGALEKLPEGWHLRYEAANEADGSAIVSDVKLRRPPTARWSSTRRMAGATACCWTPRHPLPRALMVVMAAA